MNTSTSLLRRSGKPANIPTPTTDEAMTPPMATRSRSSSVDSFDEEYFSKTYVPLSNLPTPPLSSHSNASSRQLSPDALFSPTEYLDPQLLGPAIHLTNLIPTSVSLTTSSTALVHALLTRASLPLETIALAVSILDSLNSRFALSFRKSFPLTTSSSLFHQAVNKQPHIDSIHPEIIPLSALIMAVKFLDDAQDSTRFYVENWGRGLWSCKQVNYTQWCLMDNLGGRLLPLWEESIILSALEDMERAGRGAVKDEAGREWEQCGRERGMSDGKAVVGVGEQLTPSETPLLVPQEDVKVAEPAESCGSVLEDSSASQLPSDEIA